jgi:AcrR family transcriptional regulator
VAAGRTESIERREPLSRDRIVDAAMDAADREGLSGLSMRRLGQQLGVDPMALYRHVRDKEDLLAGMREAVIASIPVAAPSPNWREAMRAQVLGARALMLRHPWAPRVIEGRADGPAVLAYVESVLAILDAGGFTLELAHHVLHVMGSRVLGFTQDLWDDSGAPEDPAVSAAFAASIAPTHPNVARLAVAATHDGVLGRCDDDVEFAFGLDLILDGFERLRAAGAGAQSASARRS